MFLLPACPHWPEALPSYGFAVNFHKILRIISGDIADGLQLPRITIKRLRGGRHAPFNYAPTKLSAPVLCHGRSNNDSILAVPRKPSFVILRSIPPSPQWHGIILLILPKFETVSWQSWLSVSVILWYHAFAEEKRHTLGPFLAVILQKGSHRDG